VRYTHQKFIASIYLIMCCIQKGTLMNLMLHTESIEHLHTKYLHDTFACYCPTHDDVHRVAYPTDVLGLRNSKLPHTCFMSLYLVTPNNPPYSTVCQIHPLFPLSYCEPDSIQHITNCTTYAIVAKMYAQAYSNHRC